MSDSVLVVWLSTYLVHSTVLLGLAWVLARGGRAGGVAPLGWREWLWRAAMLGGLTSATAQTLVDVRPVTGSLPWARTLAVEATAPPVRPPKDVRHVSFGTGVECAPTSSSPSDATATSRPDPLPGRGAAPADVSPGWIALGAGLWLLVLAWRAERALGRRRPLRQGPWHDVLRALEAEAGFRRRVRLTVSDRVWVPVALGTLRPEICVPARAVEELPAELVRPALAHELAHHVRRDPFWLGLVHLVRSLLVVQPLNRVAARELARLAELSADAWAVRRTGDRLALARCLTEVAGWLRGDEPPIAACAMVRRAGALEERVRALLDGAEVSDGGERARRTALLVTLLAAPLVLPGWSAAAEAKSPLPEVESQAVRLGHSLDLELAQIEARLAELAGRPLTREHAARSAALVERARSLREELADVLAALLLNDIAHDSRTSEGERR